MKVCVKHVRVDQLLTKVNRNQDSVHLILNFIIPNLDKERFEPIFFSKYMTDGYTEGRRATA